MRSQPTPARRLPTALTVLSLLLAIVATSYANAPLLPAPPPLFKVLTQVDLPPELHATIDLRWAGTESVYLAMGGAGVVEAPLVAGSSPIKHLVPGDKEPGGVWLANRVAASSEYLAVASPAFQVAWRRLDAAPLTEEPFEFIAGIDVRDHRLAIVGVRSDEHRNFAPDGAIGWIGSLDKRLSDLRPVAFSMTGPGAAAMAACGSYGIGYVRFLPDGSLLMIPGAQPGAELFGSDGKPLRTWDTATLGIDVRCTKLTQQQSLLFAKSYQQRLDWLNQQRTVDAILPLSQGAGVLIRSAERGKTHWQLKILHTDGTWTTVDVPIEGQSAFAHLRGDARSDRLALVLYEDGWGFRTVAKSRLITATIGR